MVLGNNDMLVDGEWSDIWFLNQYIFKDAWMDRLLSRWFCRWVQTTASLLSNLLAPTPSNSLSHSWWSLEATAVRSSFSFFLYGSLLRSEELLPNHFKEWHPSTLKNSFPIHSKKWHSSTLKNSFPIPSKNGTLPLWKTLFFYPF